MLSFYVKFVQTETDRWTTVKQYAPDLSIRGNKNIKEKIKQLEISFFFCLLPNYFLPF